MRRLSVWTLVLVLLAVLAAPASAATGAKVIVNGTDIGVEAMVEKNDLLVPAATLAKALGAEAVLNATGQEVTLQLGLQSLILEAGDQRAILNGAVRRMDVAPQKAGNDLLIPAQFVAASLGGLVTWDQAANTLTVVTGKGLLLKAMQMNASMPNQKSSGDLKMVMGITAPDVPAELSNMEMAMVIDLQLYEKDMLIAYDMKIAIPGEKPEAIVMQMAVKGGKGYIKMTGLPGWMPAGDLGLDAMVEMMQELPGMSMSSAASTAQEMVEHMHAKVVGTDELDGVKVVKVAVHMPETDFLDMIGGMLGEDMPGLDALDPENGLGLRMVVTQYEMVYYINSATGFVHKLDMVMGMRMTMPGEPGEMNFLISGTTRTAPLTEPIKFPADLPK